MFVNGTFATGSGEDRSWDGSLGVSFWQVCGDRTSENDELRFSVAVAWMEAAAEGNSIDAVAFADGNNGVAVAAG